MKKLKYLYYSHISEDLVINMGEIKVVVSEELNRLVKKKSDKLGIKKTEFVKSLLIEHFRDCGDTK